MGPTSSSSSSSPPLLFLFLSSFLLFSSPAQAFNITRLLDRFPQFSTFNSYLSQTNVSIGINRRMTITVLAVDNGAISPITGKSLDDLRNILRLHVILDYYDLAKLHKLSNKTALVTNMYQATGLADGRQGFLNVTELSSGDIVFGSAAAGSPLRSRLVKPVSSQPFNISVLQISTPLLAVGVGGVVTIPPVPPSPPPPPPSPPSPAPAPGPEGSDATPPAPPPDEAPAPSEGSSPAPAPAPGPVADAPGGSPFSSPPMADGPVRDTATRVDADSGATPAAIATCIAAVIPFMTVLFHI